MHLHFIGICGTFMAGLARIARELGHTVTGSDSDFYPPMSDQLVDMGVKTYHGFGAEIWDTIEPDLVIVGNVCKRGMPIIEAMLEKGLSYTSGPCWLGETLLKDRYVFAIAGTHGKTTTTAMLTHILHMHGIDTGYLVGGVVPSLSGSAATGQSDYFVIEADEYDSAYFDKRPKFIHYQPNTFVIGNVEFDHADIYDNIEQIERQFHYGVRLVPPSGSVIWGEGQHVQHVVDKGCWSQSTVVGESGYALVGRDIVYNDQCVAQLPELLIGIHNQRNALMACLAALQVGISLTDAAQALVSFTGVKRRLECIADIGGIRVYDDFAHHPTAIELTLTAMREHFPDKRIVSVFEPRSNTMKQGVHKDVLGEVLSIADLSFVYLADTLDWQIDGEHMIVNDTQHLCEQLLETLDAGDEVVIMSNGSFNGLHRQLVIGLQEKYGQ